MGREAGCEALGKAGLEVLARWPTRCLTTTIQSLETEFMSNPFDQFPDTFPLPLELQGKCVEVMTECIVEAVNPRRVILFGSRARGDHRPESDVDFLVEMDGRLDPDEILDVAIRARMSLAEAPLGKDFVVLGSEQLLDESTCWYSVAHHALSDGEVLYARPD